MALIVCLPYFFCSLFFFQHADVHATACWRIGSYAPVNVTRSCRGVLDTKLCDKACQWLAAGRWFSPISSRYNWNIVEGGINHNKPKPHRNHEVHCTVVSCFVIDCFYCRWVVLFSAVLNLRDALYDKGSYYSHLDILCRIICNLSTSHSLLNFVDQ
jgi:hypothetical protein